MTSHTLATWLLAGADRPIVVAGHGQLAAVTHGATTDGDQVVVLYVEQGEAECAPTGADGRDGADGTGSVSGAASGVALETPSVGDVSSVRADSAGDADGHVDVQPGLWS